MSQDRTRRQLRRNLPTRQGLPHAGSPPGAPPLPQTETATAAGAVFPFPVDCAPFMYPLGENVYVDLYMRLRTSMIHVQRFCTGFWLEGCLSSSLSLTWANPHSLHRTQAPLWTRFKCYCSFPFLCPSQADALGAAWSGSVGAMCVACSAFAFPHSDNWLGAVVG